MAEEFKGPEILKSILQLIRYDIPPLIVGKSSIGKSYTIIELTKKWRLPNDILYIGSEKPENIEGLAKLIDPEYGGGEEILKFLKPYWFPNNSTITSQVKNGRDIFESFGTAWTNKKIKFDYTYKCLYTLLVSLMEIEFSEDKDEISVQLIDSAKSYISENTEPQLLNETPFTFKRTPITKKQVEVDIESSLPTSQAGVDEIRDLCMYLTTILGFGNYWLILDELDKVDKYSQDKYAPLLHIVREKTLKNWTLQPISDKKGLKIPFSLENGYYTKVADSLDSQIEAGLPLLDTRVMGIGNASKEIEEALFRRFVQIIMEDTMALYEPDLNASRVKNCVNQNFDNFNLMDMSLMKKIGFLSDVNLAWQYDFLPKIFNQLDKGNNYFYTDFMRYYNNLKQRFPNPKDQSSRMMSGELLDKTSIGKVIASTFTGGGKAGSDEDLLKNFQTFLYCLVKDEWIDETKSTSKIGSTSSEGIELSSIDKKRLLLIKQYEQDNTLFWDKIDLKIKKDFQKNIEGKGKDSSVNLAGMQRWLNSSLLLITASNEDGKGNYNQLPNIGPKMLPFVYQRVLTLITQERLIDTDFFDSLMISSDKTFSKFLNKSDQSSQDLLTFDVKDEKINIFNNLLGFDTGYYNSIAFQIYMNKYFISELKLFLKYNMSGEGFIEFMEEPYYESVKRFLQTDKVKSILQKYYDRAKEKGKVDTNFKNLAKISQLEI